MVNGSLSKSPLSGSSRFSTSAMIQKNCLLLLPRFCFNLLVDVQRNVLDPYFLFVSSYSCLSPYWVPNDPFSLVRLSPNKSLMAETRPKVLAQTVSTRNSFRKSLYNWNPLFPIRSIFLCIFEVNCSARSIMDRGFQSPVQGSTGLMKSAHEVWDKNVVLILFCWKNAWWSVYTSRSTDL